MSEFSVSISIRRNFDSHDEIELVLRRGGDSLKIPFSMGQLRFREDREPFGKWIAAKVEDWMLSLEGDISDIEKEWGRMVTDSLEDFFRREFARRLWR